MCTFKGILPRVKSGAEDYEGIYGYPDGERGHVEVLGRSAVYSRKGLSGTAWESKYLAHRGIYVKVQFQNGSITKSSEIRDSASLVD